MHRYAIAVAAALVPLPAAAANVDPFTSFWVLGDSLSDPGNLFRLTGGARPQSPPYFDGRFSNGPVWAEAVAGAFEDAGVPGANFAFGGAEAATDFDGIPDLAAQIDVLEEISDGRRGQRPLASIWLGANDIFGGFVDGDPTGAAEEAIAAIDTGVDRLAALGFADLLVFNLPDLGDVPIFAGSSLSDAASAVTGFFNGSLADLLTDRPGLSVTQIDIEALFEDLTADPAAFGVSDVSTPCLIPGSDPCTPEQAQARAFFDDVHPNATVHAFVAQTAFDALAIEPSPIPLPAGLPLLLASIGALGAVRVASRRA